MLRNRRYTAMTKFGFELQEIIKMIIERATVVALG